MLIGIICEFKIVLKEKRESKLHKLALVREYAATYKRR